MRWITDNYRTIIVTLTITLFISLSLLFQGTAIPYTPVHAENTQPNIFDCTTVSEIPQIECEALVALYNNTNGSGWANNTGWLNTTTPCDWAGVACEAGHISVLDMQQNQLSGNVPTSLANLSNLLHLYLHKNQISGTIPPELGNLSSLKYLSLHANQLSGNIPIELGSLSNLIYLNLGENQLNGTIPAELGNLPNLLQLYLYKNQLSGPIPSTLGTLSNLNKLDLYGNQLSGPVPSELGNLSALTHLYLDTNRLSGPIPSTLGNLSHLTELWLYSNQLSGPIPSELGNLSLLISLRLYSNQLNGTIPTALGSLSALTLLDLHQNKLSGSIPSELGNLLHLNKLDLYGNQLDGTIPSELGNLPNLTKLYLDTNQLSGPIPSALGNLSHLEELWLFSNQLSGAIPSELGSLSTLTYLSLHTNQLSGIIPTTLGNLSALNHLDLHANQFDGSIPSAFGNLTKLTTLYLQESQIGGSIPPELGNLSSLQFLHIYANQLSGPIPAALGNLSNLEVLTAYSNQLSGPIPAELGNLPKLEWLSLYSNQLSGTIPAALGNLSNLSHLHLYNNQLSGTIPSELGSLSALIYLDLSGNQLNGVIPATLANLSNLTTLRLGHNALTATDSTLLAFLAQKDPEWADTQEAGTPTPMPPTHTPIPTSTLVPTTTPTPTHTAIPTTTPANTPIPTNTLVPTNTSMPPTQGDIYEPNNLCTQAAQVLVDDVAQMHTFHTSADIDWVRLDPVAGTQYVVEVEIPNDSEADVNLELHSQCEGNVMNTFHESFTPGARLEFEAASNAPLYLRLANQDATVAGDDVTYGLTVQSLTDSSLSGAVILLAGRYRLIDMLQNNIHNVTDDAFALFQANGYTVDDIHYLATDSELVGYDQAATKSSLRDAITNWAVDRVGPNNALTLYLIDHGDEDVLYIDQPTGEQVTPTELNSWLEILEQAKPGVQINIIIEACHSGSFVDALSQPNSNRIIITSTNVTWDAYASRHGAHFSDYFLTSLRQGRNLFRSFIDAQSRVNDLYPLQEPWLEADGNGIPNEATDYAIASERGFAYAGTFSDSWPPYIASVQEPIISNGQGSIRVEVRDNSRVEDVWAVIYSPNYAPPASSVELVQEGSDEMISVLLNPNGDEQYSVNYPGFTTNGTYRIAIHAKDNDGLTARPVIMEVDILGGADTSDIGSSENIQLFLPVIIR